MFDVICTFILLVVLEVVLGVDNFLFLSRNLATLSFVPSPCVRPLIACAALAMRIAIVTMLLSVIHSHVNVVSTAGFTLSLRDVVLISGGLFLFGKSVSEMVAHADVSAPDFQMKRNGTNPQSFTVLVRTVLSLTLLDTVCSADSLLTAVAMSEQFWLILFALLTAEVVMMCFHKRAQLITQQDASIQQLANSFVAFLGVLLTFRGLGLTMPGELLYGVLIVFAVVRFVKFQLVSALKWR